MILYYAELRSVLHKHPDLRRCLKHCQQCGIFFLTDPRNACRKDLFCAFGCREAHRRASSARRSGEFYGRYPEEKRRQNRQRYLHSARSTPTSPAPPVLTPTAPIVQYACVLLRLVERRRVALEEVLELLAKKGRQRRMGRWRKGGYGGRKRKQKDP